MAKCVCTACECPNKGITSLDGYCHECDEGTHRGRVALSNVRVFETTVRDVSLFVVEDRHCVDHPDYSMDLMSIGRKMFYCCKFCSCKYPA